MKQTFSLGENMRSRDRKVGNYVAWGRGSSGRLKECKYCGETIYMKQDRDGKWRPYESWQAGNADEGEFKLHNCGGGLH